jgi:hypothetical protein
MNNTEIPHFRNEYIDYIEKKKINYEGDVKFNSNPYIKSLGDYPINEVPQFIHSNELDQLKMCISTLPRLIIKLIRYKLEKSDPNFFKMIGFNENCIGKSINRNILDNLCYRADLILTDSGFKVVEMNVGTNLGGWDMRFHEAAFIKSKIINNFLTENNFQIKCRDPLVNFVKMLSSSVKNLDTYSEEIQSTIVIALPNYDKTLTDFIMSMLNGISESQSNDIYFTFVHSVDEITHDKGKGYIDGNTIHGIIFPTRTWGKGDRNFSEEILNLWWSNKIILPENPVSITMGDKRILAELYQEKNNAGYSDDEVKIIEKFVPVSIPLMSNNISLREVIDKKNSLVIKPGIGLQGEQVLVGKYVSTNHWKNTIFSEYGKSEFILQHF